MAVRVAFVMGEYPQPERVRRTEVAESYSGPDLEVSVLTVEGASPYRALMTPYEVQMSAPRLIEGFIEAQRQGFDAAVPLGMLDLGVEGARSAVDIPIVGPLQASLQIAATLGDRFGLITYRDESIGPCRARVRGYGMIDWIAGFRSSRMKMTDYAKSVDRLTENFVAAARSLIQDDGADVIIPAGASQCPIHLDPKWVMEQIGVPVVEAFGAPIQLAATLVRLGVTQSRVRHPKVITGEDD